MTNPPPGATLDRIADQPTPLNGASTPPWPWKIAEQRQRFI
jgi:hypothetical protein